MISCMTPDVHHRESLLRSGNLERYCNSMSTFYECVLEYLGRCQDVENCSWGDGTLDLEHARNEYYILKAKCSFMHESSTTTMGPSAECNGKNVFSCQAADIGDGKVPKTREGLKKYCESMPRFYECVLDHLERCQGSPDYEWSTGILSLENFRKGYAMVKSLCSEKFPTKTDIVTVADGSSVCNGKNVFSCKTPDIGDGEVPTTREGLKEYCESMPRFYKCVLDHLERCEDSADYEWSTGILSLESFRKGYAMVNAVCRENYPTEADFVTTMDPSTVCNGKDVFACRTPDIGDGKVPTTRRGLQKYCESVPKYYKCVVEHLERCQGSPDYEWATGTLSLESFRKGYEMVKSVCLENYPTKAGWEKEIDP